MKILLQPGVSIGTVSVARMSKSSALDIIAAMKKLASLQLGKFVEVSNLLGEYAYLKLRVFPSGSKYYKNYTRKNRNFP